jgi:hypothetical protein
MLPASGDKEDHQLVPSSLRMKKFTALVNRLPAAIDSVYLYSLGIRAVSMQDIHYYIKKTVPSAIAPILLFNKF